MSILQSDLWKEIEALLKDSERLLKESEAYYDL